MLTGDGEVLGWYFCEKKKLQRNACSLFFHFFNKNKKYHQQQTVSSIVTRNNSNNSNINPPHPSYFIIAVLPIHHFGFILIKSTYHTYLKTPQTIK